MKKGAFMKRIKVNKIRCNKCGDEIESTHRHHYIECSCGAVFTDGGHDYLRRGGQREDWTDLSEFEDVPDEETKNLSSRGER